MTAFPVPALVNKPANDTPECILPLPAWEKDPALRI
jgi:hypothetical protein